MIGPKGNAINEILQDTGVFVEMPSSDSPSETITLRGPQEKLGLGEFVLKSKLGSLKLICCVCDILSRNKMTLLIPCNDEMIFSDTSYEYFKYLDSN